MTNAITQSVIRPFLSIANINNTQKGNNSNALATENLYGTKAGQLNMAQMAELIKNSANVDADQGDIEKKAKNLVRGYEKFIKKTLTTVSAKYYVLQDIVNGKIKTEDLKDDFSTTVTKDGKTVLVRFVKNENGDYDVYSQEGSLKELEKLRKIPAKQLKVSCTFAKNTLNGEVVRNFPQYYAKYKTK